MFFSSGYAFHCTEKEEKINNKPFGLKDMKLKDIGERALTYKITYEMDISFDDCAVMDMGEYYQLLTTDMVSSGKHFPPGTPHYHMGWYAMAVNISDIAAKGGEPLAYLIAMGLPREMEEEDYTNIIRGLKECAGKYGGKIVGGDTKEMDSIAITIAAVGKVKKEEFMARKGAMVGDAVYVTGELGRGGAALREKNLDELLLIKPRLDEGRLLASSGMVNACMDMSDGFSSSLYQMMKVNGKGFRIYGDKIPIHGMAKKYEDALELALHYGGDYELLFTLPPEKGKKLEKKMRITRVGEVIEEEKVVILMEDKEKIMENRGYEHFR